MSFFVNTVPPQGNRTIPYCLTCKRCVDRAIEIPRPDMDMITVVLECHGDTEKHEFSRHELFVRGDLILLGFKWAGKWDSEGCYFDRETL